MILHQVELSLVKGKEGEKNKWQKREANHPLVLSSRKENWLYDYQLFVIKETKFNVCQPDLYTL